MLHTYCGCVGKDVRYINHKYWCTLSVCVYVCVCVCEAPFNPSPSPPRLASGGEMDGSVKVWGFLFELAEKHAETPWAQHRTSTAEMQGKTIWSQKTFRNLLQRDPWNTFLSLLTRALQNIHPFGADTDAVPVTGSPPCVCVCVCVESSRSAAIYQLWKANWWVLGFFFFSPYAFLNID